MPTSKKVDLNDALEDSPQTQKLVSDMEQSVNPLKEFTVQLKEACQVLHTNQLKVSESVNTLAKVLASVNDQTFGQKDVFMSEALKQLGKYVTELHCWQDMLCTQIDHAVVQQLDSLINNDLTRLTSLKEAFHTARTDHDQAMVKYSRVSKKKETERSRFDANSELFSSRRRFHQSSLQYYSELTSFDYKKRFAILDPLLAFMHSQLAYFKMGHEILTDEVGKFLTSLNVEIQKVRGEHDQTVRQQKQVSEQLEQQSAQSCIPDPDPSDPFVEYQPANLHLTAKSGYLLYKQQGSKWERMYFYTKGHLLYSQIPQKPAEVFLDLTAEGVDASSTDMDDKRYVFQIIAISQQSQTQQSQRKPLFFQAESAKSRDEWVATIINIVSKRLLPQTSIDNELKFVRRERSDSDLIRIERQRIRTFVQAQMISPEKQQNVVMKQPRPPPRPPPPQTQLQQQQKRTRAPPPPLSSNNSVQQLLEIADNANMENSSDGYHQTFIVRYLGSLEVYQNKGVGIVKDTIRKIIAARALKNLMTVYIVNMVITHRVVSLMDQVSNRVTTQFKLKDVSYCAKHPDNEKLFGIIARMYQDGKQIHVCYVFEAETSGKAICQSVIEAIRVAVKIVTGIHTNVPSLEGPTPSFDLPSPTSMASVFSTPPSIDRSKSPSEDSFQSDMKISLPEDVERDSSVALRSKKEESLIDFMSDPVTNVPSQPISSVPVSQPMISVPVSQPMTNIPVLQPMMNVAVSQPMTSLPVSQPMTSVPVSQTLTNIPPVSQPMSNVPVSQPMTSLLPQDQPQTQLLGDDGKNDSLSPDPLLTSPPIFQTSDTPPGSTGLLNPLDELQRATEEIVTLSGLTDEANKSTLQMNENSPTFFPTDSEDTGQS